MGLILVLGYAHANISKIGLVESVAETVLKPPEFGSTGDYWGDNGLLVHVNW